MKIRKLSERIRAAIKAAAERLVLAKPPMDQPLGTPGDLFVFSYGGDVAIEWLVVRAHPDDPGWILMVPVDDFPFAGTSDFVLPVERPMTARCNQTDWFPKSFLNQRCRVDALPDDIIRQVRQRLADLARGRAIVKNPNVEFDPECVDVDPEYEDHMDEVEKARLTLLSRANR